MKNLVKYELAALAGYSLNIANKGVVPYDPRQLAIKSNFSDVIVTRPTMPTDLDLLHTNALMTVNGFIHNTVMIDDKFYIEEANKAILRSKQFQIGIVDFTCFEGELDRRHITADMITPEPGHSLYKRANITFNEPVDGCFFVFAGYLIEENTTSFRRTSDRSFVITLEKLELVDRIMEMTHFYDIFGELGVEVSPTNKHVVNYLDLISDDSVIKLLTRFNTFLVNFKDHYVDIEKSPLYRGDLQTHFRTDIRPILPLVGGRGRLIEYKGVVDNEFSYAVETVDAYYNNLVTLYAPPGEGTLTNGHRFMNDKTDISPVAFMMMKIGKY